jgi:hypothetical protein
LLLGAAGGVAALAAHLLGRPLPVNANDPNDVVLGGVNTSTSVTSIENTTADPFATTYGIRGETHINGAGVLGVGVSGANGIEGRTDWGGGVIGESSSPGGVGVVGSGGYQGVVAEGDRYGLTASAPINEPLAVGVYAYGYRGGEFIGQKAQIRLQPSGVTHPATGKAGDIFLDGKKRLWLCKGKTNWVRLDPTGP